MKNILLTTAIAISLTTPAFASDYKKHKIKGDTGAPGVVDYSLVNGYDAAVAGMAGLEIVTPDQKGWSWSGGFGGTDLESTVSFGLAYGVGETTMLYGKMSNPFNSNATSYFVGLSGKF